MKHKLHKIISNYIFKIDRGHRTGIVYAYEILRLRFDRRKWYYSKTQYEKAGKDWNSIVFFLEYEVTNDEGVIDPDFIRIPWHWRFSYTLRNWAYKKPLGWFAIGWLIRAIIGA